MITVGITGGIGSGKSTVTEIFKICGVPVYIADERSKVLTATSPTIRKKIIELFGHELYANEELNKPLLASLIFTDKENLHKVNAIIHPEVEKDYRKWVSINSRNNLILAKEAAILFESGFNRFVDKTIMVYAPLETRIKRTIKRDGVERMKVLDRIQNQMPDEEKVKLSDFIIVNDGTRSLIEQVLTLIYNLEKNQ